MKIRSLLVLPVAFVALTAASLSAQSGSGAATVAATAKPNFAGKWTLVPDAATSGQQSAQVSAFAGLGTEATITHDATAVTVSRFYNGAELKSVFKLDGSVSQNSLALGPDMAIPLSARSSWEGNKLLTSMTANFGGQDYALTMNLSLDAAGLLVVDMTTPPMGGAPTSFTMKYRKN
jgi:hypothetical protein